MKGYVVSKGGTFGVAVRTYMATEPMVVIEWGLLRWVTPVESKP